jgi:hypothetical protein
VHALTPPLHTQINRPAVRQGVNRVQDQVRQTFAQVGCRALDRRVAIRPNAQLDAAALFLGAIAPCGRSEVGNLGDECAQIELAGRVALRGGARMFAVVSPTGPRRVRTQDGPEGHADGLGPGVAVEVADSQLSVPGDQGEALVQIMGDATGHLSERAQLLRLRECFALSFRPPSAQ